MKDLSLETLRGFAILMVVAGYIIKEDLSQGAGHSVISSALHFIYYCLTPIRMPLFTVISAYLYAASPVTRETFSRLVTGKARRILIPFAVVSALQYAIFSFTAVNGPQPIGGIYKVYLWPYEQLWFLLSIFWIFIMVAVIDSFHLMDTRRKWLIGLFLSTAAHLLVHPTPLFSFSGVNYLLPFFLMGYGIRRFSDEFFSGTMIRIYLAVAFFAYPAYIGLFLDPVFARRLPINMHHLLGLMITFSAVPLIFHFRRTVPFLATVGPYTFGIYLFNKVGLVPIKILFAHFEIKNDGLIFVCYWAGSVILAIAIHALMDQHAVTRGLILGMREAPVMIRPPVKI
ncbi:MAG: acyltransferase [Candidatus Omnitrophica bacterium]|nr:acyltransferase [Candidatus Omnitrophota bacterium]